MSKVVLKTAEEFFVDLYKGPLDDVEVQQAYYAYVEKTSKEIEETEGGS